MHRARVPRLRIKSSGINRGRQSPSATTAREDRADHVPGRKKSVKRMCQMAQKAGEAVRRIAEQRAPRTELIPLVVHFRSAMPKPYQARVRRGGKWVNLGQFATAEEAVLCVARSPEGKALAERAAAAPREEVYQALLLQPARSGTFYFFGTANPYQTWMRRGCTAEYLGTTATAEEAALCVARSAEAEAEEEAEAEAEQAAPPLGRGQRRRSPPGSLSEEEEDGHGNAPARKRKKAPVKAPKKARRSRRRKAPATVPPSALKSEGTVPPMPPDAFVKAEDTPSSAVVKGEVPPMPPDAFVKVEVVVKEEERAD